MRFTTLGCQPNTKLHGTENTSLLLMKTENVRWIVKGSCILVDVCVNSLSIRQRGCRCIHRDFWRDQCTIACFDVFPFVDHGLFSTPVQQYLKNFQKKCDVWCVGKQRVPNSTPSGKSKHLVLCVARTADKNKTKQCFGGKSPGPKTPTLHSASLEYRCKPSSLWRTIPHYGPRTLDSAFLLSP